MIIPHITEPDATYELRRYIHYEPRSMTWALCRNGEMVRWLDKYERHAIESVVKFMEGR